MNIFSDIAAAVKLTREVREAQRLGYKVHTSWTKEVFPVRSGGARDWPWTMEGCCFSGTEFSAPIREVFRLFDEQTRRALLKSPSAWDFDGYIERARFWQQALKPALPRDQYYAAMSSLWKDYLRAMRAGCAAAGKGVI